MNWIYLLTWNNQKSETIYENCLQDAAHPAIKESEHYEVGNKQDDPYDYLNLYLSESFQAPVQGEQTHQD